MVNDSFYELANASIVFRNSLIYLLLLKPKINML